MHTWTLFLQLRPYYIIYHYARLDHPRADPDNAEDAPQAVLNQEAHHQPLSFHPRRSGWIRNRDPHQKLIKKTATPWGRHGTHGRYDFDSILP